MAPEAIGARMTSRANSIVPNSIIIVGGGTYGAYKLYKKYSKYTSDIQSCKLQCENIASCGNAERTAQYQDNASRCIAACESYTTVEDWFGIGKGPTGPKSPAPDPTPNYFKPNPPGFGEP